MICPLCQQELTVDYFESKYGETIATEYECSIKVDLDNGQRLSHYSSGGYSDRTYIIIYPFRIRHENVEQQTIYQRYITKSRAIVTTWEHLFTTNRVSDEASIQIVKRLQKIGFLL
jgi:hypothetical protein